MKNSIIPNELRKHRKLNNLRQIDVAYLLGFKSTDRISRWEKGIAFPHPINIFKLSAIYNTLPHELYCGLLENIIKQVKNIKIENMITTKEKTGIDAFDKSKYESRF